MSYVVRRCVFFFFFSSRRRHTRFDCDWSSDVCSSDLSTSYSVTISPTGGFSGQVNLSVSGLPSGASGSFAPNPATASSTLSVTTGTGTPVGPYTLTITGVSGSLTHTTTVSLVVTAPVNFTLGASPSSQTVLPGGSTSYSVTISPTGGFSGQVNLSVSGLPSGASGSFRSEERRVGTERRFRWAP